jgi:hypothetical protein
VILSELLEVWAVERASAHRDSSEGRRLQSAKAVEAYAGVDRSGTARFVALRLAAAERKTVAECYPRSSRGIAVEPVEGGAGKLAFFLREQPGTPEGVFPAVMEDVLEAGEAAPPGKGLRVALERFSSWQAALSKQRGEMSAQEARGIFGELVAARDLLVPQLGMGRMVQVWRAPEDDHPHDFVGKGWELEVKTFLAPGDAFHVNADGQLDPEPSNRLFLATVSLEAAEDGISLHELAEQMLDEKELEAGVREDLKNALIRRGGMARSLDVEATRRYRVGSLELYEVREGFPRIAPKQLPRGVSAVRYEVSLGACGEFRTDAGTLATSIKTMEKT